MSDREYRKAAELLASANHAVALTGAGISTPSGIPDFRSPGTGIWENADPAEMVSIDSFLRNPGAFFSFLSPLIEKIAAAPPNPAHATLAKWERQNRLRALITQNIDSLHQKAGSSTVIELHGTCAISHCTECARSFTAEAIYPAISSGAVPRCDCGAIIKPDVVLFGEALPKNALEAAQHHAESCDLMIAIASSLTVSPASIIPQIAKRCGAALIIINLQPTYLDNYADVLIRERVEIALPAIDDRIL